MNSIQDFIKKGIPKIEDIVARFLQNPQKEAEFEQDLLSELYRFMLNTMSEAYTSANTVIKDSHARKTRWNVVKTVEKKMLCSVGEFSYKETVFVDKTTGKNAALVNDYLGIAPHQRFTEAAVARMLNEAVQTSYRRAGNESSILEQISKEAVKDYLHRLEFPADETRAGEKRAVKILFIEADEDHCPLQFLQTRGDMETGENNWKNNCALVKLIYVHEGIEKEDSVRREGEKNRRRHLINPHYFAGVYDGSGENRKLWDEVYAYIQETYDLDKVEKICLMSDGGAWIRTGRTMISGLTPVLDEFHLRKYLLKMTRHMLDSADDARKEICGVIKDGSKEDFRKETQKMLGYANTDSERKHVQEGSDYILSNWSAAKTRLSGRKWLTGCSAEGHVSHVLSDRMSSRPMGWSRTGADKMARLRAYCYNGNSLLELVRYQKKPLEKAAGAEEVICSCRDILASESMASRTKTEQEIGKYAEAMRASLPVQVRKMTYVGGRFLCVK